MTSVCQRPRSRTWFVSPQERRPNRRKQASSTRAVEFFIDRSLGRKHLSGALQELGFTVHTMASVYGETVAQELEDERWTLGDVDGSC
jgi:hypothetical protein